MSIINVKTGGLTLFKAVYQPRNPLTKEPEYFASQPRQTKEQARKDEAHLIKEWEKQRHILLGVVDAKMLLTDAFRTWYKSFTKAERTYDTYRSTDQFLAAYFPRTRVKKLNWAQIKAAAIDFAKGKSNDSDSSVSRRLAHLASFLRYCTEHQIIPNSPMPKFYLTEIFGNNLTVKTANKKATDPYKARNLEYDELAQLREHLYNYDYISNTKYGVSRVGLIIATRTGIRPGELQMLNASKFIWNDDQTRLAFTIDDEYNDKYNYLEGRTKNGLERRTVYLTEQETKIIQTFIAARDAYLASHGFIVADDAPLLLALNNWQRLRNQQPITNRALNKMIKELAKTLKWSKVDKIKYYSLRHTFGSDRATKVNGNYKIAADLMGHSVEMYMNRYVKTFSDDLSEQYDI